VKETGVNSVSNDRREGDGTDSRKRLRKNKEESARFEKHEFRDIRLSNNGGCTTEKEIDLRGVGPRYGGKATASKYDPVSEAWKSHFKILPKQDKPNRPRKRGTGSVTIEDSKILWGKTLLNRITRSGKVRKKKKGTSRNHDTWEYKTFYRNLNSTKRLCQKKSKDRSNLAPRKLTIKNLVTRAPKDT